MPVWSIILLAFIFAGAIGFSLWKNFLPRRFTLFGVKYGDKFKDQSKKMKIKIILVYVFTVIFSAANIIAPLRIRRLFRGEMRNFLFILVYIICLIIWLVVLTRKDIAKKYYDKEIRKILDNTPLYTAVVEYLYKSRTDRNGGKSPQHAYNSVVPFKDGIALFFRRLSSYDLVTDVGGSSKSNCRYHRDIWKEETEREWSSVYEAPGTAVIFPSAEYGYEELSHQDMKDFCIYLAREAELDLVHEELCFSHEFKCEYTVVTTYESGWEDRDDREKSATGSVFVHAALSKEPKKK